MNGETICDRIWENMPCEKKSFIYDYYKTVSVLYIALYFILIERSEVKLRLFFKSHYSLYIDGGGLLQEERKE